ncbi:hypothetical protein [Thiolapillus brandeum]|uniref:Uncharacterized protein n=1 Tax=Thiolapillus brandeum TaxID=1076588 RepID=A0A7U6JJD3_9GAMM|nr:hypothetical protein [Thiolapillus brandeum]BAO45458.1 conserved hypothetical protein [Thiolapillus brandeum]
MSNSVRVSATFSFRGQLLEPEMHLDLDQALEQGMKPESLYALLGRRNGIDPYSYEYEMLEAEPLVFDQPEGIAGNFVNNGQLDWEGLEKAWKEANLIENLSRIARTYMDIRELDDVPGLRETLLAVHQNAKH